MKKNIYTISSLPSAKNGMNSRSAFIQRTSYEYFMEKAVKKNIDIEFLDTRFEFKDFLKYDKNNNLINVSETHLKNIADDIYVIDFVADAFNELKTLCKNSKTISDTKLKNISAKKGWSSLHKKYHDHMTSVFEAFLKNITQTKRNKNILNFEDFVVEMISYLDLVAFKTPFLKSSYFASKNFHISELGFCIEIDTANQDADKNKFQKYFQSYSYEEFIKLCKRTNFAIDKDCPWRLIYLPYSDMSEKYMSAYNINKDTFIEQYFYKTESFDIENLKSYMLIFYNTFIQRQPVASNPTVEKHFDKTITVNKLTTRIPVTIEEINNKYDVLFWFHIYSHIKIVENKIKINNEQYKILLKNLKQTYKINGNMAAMQEIKNTISNSEYVENKDQYKFEIPPPRS
jgi:hypothetical protein